MHDELGKILGGVLESKSPEEWEEHDRQIREQREQEHAERALRQRTDRGRALAEDGVPVKDLDRVIDGSALVETEALRRARAAMSGGWWLWVLAGAPGRGKTTAATWWLLQDRPWPRYVTPERRRFVQAKRLQRWPQYDDAQMRLVERSQALVIDDLGVEYLDQHGNWLSLLDGIVDARYSAMLPTLITTNLSAEEFKRRYGERLADRVREGGGFVGAGGESLRKGAA